MERQIKFRAWNPDDKKMETPLVLAIVNDGTLNFKPLINCRDGNKAYKDYPLMQFTGLQDKNGKDIFEGDIVSFETDPKGVVRWNNHVLCYTYYEDYKEDEITNSDFLWDWGQLKKEESKHYIVHGNIYENPELLNSQK